MDIKIKDLCEWLGQQLSNVPNLKNVYIGKTSDSESAKTRHSSDSDEFILIANGDPGIISKAENYLINNLGVKIPQEVNIKNINSGSAGNPNANYIYVCLDWKAENIDELYDADFLSEPFHLVL